MGQEVKQFFSHMVGALFVIVGILDTELLLKAITGI
jgi:hypothetical protein